MTEITGFQNLTYGPVPPMGRPKILARAEHCQLNTSELIQPFFNLSLRFIRSEFFSFPHTTIVLFISLHYPFQHFTL